MTKFSDVVALILLVVYNIGGNEAKSANRKVTRLDDVVDTWQGKWFPHPPEETDTHSQQQQIPPIHQHQYCDTVTSIVDYNPKDKRHSYNYLCLSNRTLFQPNLETTALLTENLIPPAYVPSIVCEYKSIEYNTESIPTFGSFRPYAPRYGNYKYLPVQRWIHSLAEGAIVMLYHPCANSQQVKLLQKTLQGCLYRHIITPTQLLQRDRPMALLSWGKILAMSVLDEHMVIKFIKENAKHGPISDPPQLKDNVPLYEMDLLEEAHLITDMEDVEICGYTEM